MTTVELSEREEILFGVWLDLKRKRFLTEGDLQYPVPNIYIL